MLRAKIDLRQTSFSLRLTEDRDVNVSSRQGSRNTLFITERYVKLYRAFTHSHTLSLDSYCRPTAAKSSSPAGLSTLVYAYVVDCAPASPYAYSSYTHRFPDERTPIASFSDICGAWFGFGSGSGIGFTGTLLLARAPLLLATILSHTTIPFPRVHWCVVVRLVHTSLGLSYLIAHVLHYPPPPTRTALY